MNRWMNVEGLPERGSRWLHTNGNAYYVLTITNKPNEERYPTMIVYQGENGEVWSRRADDWHRSMTQTADTV